MTSIKYLPVSTLFFVLSSLICSSLSASTAFTLRQCVDKGLADNPGLKAYELSIKESQLGVKESYGEFLPTLALNYNYAELQNDNKSDPDEDFLDNTNKTLTLRISQPIFSGFSGVTAVKRAYLTSKYSKEQLVQGRLNIIDRIATAFYDRLRALKHIELRKASVERLEKQNQIVTAWVEQRLAPKLRVLETGVELSNARLNLIRAISDEAVAVAQLSELIAIQADESFSISGSFDDPSSNPCTTLSQCVELAVDGRPEIKMATLNVEIAGRDADTILAKNSPIVSLDGSYIDYQRDFDESIQISSTESYSGEERDYYSVLLQVSFKPFQGGRNYHAYRKQKIAVQRLKQTLINTQNEIISAVKIRYERREENLEAIETTAKTVKEAEAAYEVAGKSAELGVVSLRDVLDAEIRLTRAKIDFVDAKYGYKVANAKLRVATARR